MDVGLALPQYDFSLPGGAELDWASVAGWARHAERAGLSSVWLADQLSMSLARYGGPGDERFCLELPRGYPDLQAAPLLCAGLIGYRALRLAGDAERLGLYGFGSSAHIICQVAVAQGRRVFAFTRAGDTETQALARELGAEWAGAVADPAVSDLDAAIIFAPAGELIPEALRALAPGGTAVCAGIHMSDIPSFPYELLWGERRVCSVANLTRRDGDEFLALAPEVPVRTEVVSYPLEQANEALARLREGRIRGAAVLLVGEGG